MSNRDFIQIFYWLSMHDAKAYGSPRAHILPFKFYERCRGASIMSAVMRTKTGDAICRTALNLAMDRAAESVSELTDDYKKLGYGNIMALWKHIGNREKIYILNPTPANAELEMSMDILGKGGSAYAP